MDEPGMVVVAGEVALRRMRPDAGDYRRMARWLSDPRVLEWYEGRDRPQDERSVAAKWGRRALGEDPVEACIILYRSEPIGYLQFYPVADAADYDLDDATATWAIDLFIGEPPLWGHGIGSQLLRAVVRYLVRERGAARVVIDPRLENRRAIRAYERPGFRRLRVLPAHEFHEGAWRDCLLMGWPAEDA